MSNYYAKVYATYLYDEDTIKKGLKQAVLSSVLRGSDIAKEICFFQNNGVNSSHPKIATDITGPGLGISSHVNIAFDPKDYSILAGAPIRYNMKNYNGSYGAFGSNDVGALVWMDNRDIQWLPEYSFDMENVKKYLKKLGINYLPDILNDAGVAANAQMYDDPDYAPYDKYDAASDAAIDAIFVNYRLRLDDKSQRGLHYLYEYVAWLYDVVAATGVNNEQWMIVKELHSPTSAHFLQSVWYHSAAKLILKTVNTWANATITYDGVTSSYAYDATKADANGNYYFSEVSEVYYNNFTISNATELSEILYWKRLRVVPPLNYLSGASEPSNWYIVPTSEIAMGDIDVNAVAPPEYTALVPGPLEYDHDTWFDLNYTLIGMDTLDLPDQTLYPGKMYMIYHVDGDGSMGSEWLTLDSTRVQEVHPVPDSMFKGGDSANGWVNPEVTVAYHYATPTTLTSYNAVISVVEQIKDTASGSAIAVAHSLINNTATVPLVWDILDKIGNRSKRHVILASAHIAIHSSGVLYPSGESQKAAMLRVILPFIQVGVVVSAFFSGGATAIAYELFIAVATDILIRKVIAPAIYAKYGHDSNEARAAMLIVAVGAAYASGKVNKATLIDYLSTTVDVMCKTQNYMTDMALQELIAEGEDWLEESTKEMEDLKAKQKLLDELDTGRGDIMQIVLQSVIRGDLTPMEPSVYYDLNDGKLEQGFSTLEYTYEIEVEGIPTP